MGRYGDAVDPDGWIKGFNNLVAMLRSGGKLYMSVPIATECRVNFNAHRVFSIPSLINLFNDKRSTVDMAIVDDSDQLITHVDWMSAGSDFKLNFGCGIIEAICHG